MTKDEFLRLAIKFNLIGTSNREGVFSDALYQFTKAVEALERESCALICDGHADDPVYCGNAIRARGETE